MKLYVLLTQSHCPIPILDAARIIIASGADVVQMREKALDDKALIALGRKLRAITREAGVTFIVNDRPDIARLVDADGVHLGQEDLPPAAARAVLGPGRIIGVSTHNLDQARAALRAGADYIGAGPVFPTATRGYDTGVGPEYVRAAAHEIPLPLVAIGGITPDRVGQILAAAGRPVAIAVCAAILGAADIAAATRQFKQAILAAEPLALHGTNQVPYH